LQALAASYALRYEAADSQPEKDYFRRQLAALNDLTDFALPLLDRLEALPASAMWGGWLEQLASLATAALRNPEAVLDLLDELQPLSDTGPVGLSDVLMTLEPQLLLMRGEVAGSRYGCVFAGGIEEARGMSFDTVFVPGLNEGIFPRSTVEDPLLLDSLRGRLGLPCGQDDNHLLRLAAVCAANRLVLSYSRLDLFTGRPRIPSFYVFEAARAAHGTALDVSKLESAARAAVETRIGWPAPRSASDAIDDIEYDLAALQPMMADVASNRGGAAYLTRVNDHLIRSLRTRWRRWHSEWSAADGLVGLDIEALQILEEHRVSRRAYSPSALQLFAVCPYRFALRAIHGLAPAEHPAPLVRPDPLLRGELYHRAQFELLRSLESSGALGLLSEKLPDAWAQLDVVLNRVARSYAEDYAPSVPRIWWTFIESVRADLRGWLTYLATSGRDWMPAFFELSFGIGQKDGHDPASVREAVTIGDYKLRGSIDMVERHTSGALRVTDHKTGAIPDPKPVWVGRGETLQPLLYAMAAEAVLGEKVISGRLHYATLRRNYQVIEIPASDAARARARQVLSTIDGSLRSGFIPAAPREKACANCEYQVVCGPYEQERTAMKSQPELRHLAEIRRLW
jgi:RecB family exonuclease